MNLFSSSPEFLSKNEKKKTEVFCPGYLSFATITIYKESFSMIFVKIFKQKICNLISL